MMPNQPLDNPFLREEPIPDRDSDFQFSRTSRQAEGARCALDMTRLRVQIRYFQGSGGLLQRMDYVKYGEINKLNTTQRNVSTHVSL